MINIYSDEYFMRMALREAQEALLQDEIPIGAILVDPQNKVIAKGRNQVELLNDPTAHAEMLCLSAGFEYLNAKYLNQCTIYVTLEPCPMCAGALFWSQIGKIVYGTHDKKRGLLHPYIEKQESIPYLHPKTIVVTGVLENECGSLLTDFFKSKRKS